jgi:hypothetical protein
MRSFRDSRAVAATRPTSRSRISNRGAALPGVDGHSTWVRRLRDLIESHTSDLGGEDAVSEAERSIIRRIATLTVELERMEVEFAAASSAQPDQLDLYQRTVITHPYRPARSSFGHVGCESVADGGECGAAGEAAGGRARTLAGPEPGLSSRPEPKPEVSS